MKDRKESYFVRNDVDKQQRRLFSLGDAFKCASQGFIYTLKTQRNVKIYAVFVFLAVLLGIVFSIPLSSWLAVLICIGMVFTAECINTALESLVDLVSPSYAKLAKQAKDCAAAGVLISAIISFVVGICVYGNAFLSMIALFI